MPVVFQDFDLAAWQHLQLKLHNFPTCGLKFFGTLCWLVEGPFGELKRLGRNSLWLWLLPSVSSLSSDPFPSKEIALFQKINTSSYKGLGGKVMQVSQLLFLWCSHIETQLIFVDEVFPTLAVTA